MSELDDMTASNGIQPEDEDDEFGSEDYDSDDDELDPEEDWEADEE